MVDRSVLVFNERIKLLAAAFDRGSTATLVAGVFGPIASSLYHVPGAPDLASSPAWLLTIAWRLVATVLHIFAHSTLAQLR